MPSCSVVIPVHNQAALTRQCLDALLAPPGEDAAFELIVVDDASIDETPRLLAGYTPRIRVMTHPVNRGFATACNGGAAVATGDRLVFLNNDTIPRPGWLDALVDYAAAHPAAAAVGGKLLFPDGRVQHAGVVFDQQRYPRVLYEGFPAEHPAVNRSRRFQAVTAACMLVSRVAFDAVGGFDTAYRNGRRISTSACGSASGDTRSTTATRASSPTCTWRRGAAMPRSGLGTVGSIGGDGETGSSPTTSATIWKTGSSRSTIAPRIH